MTSWSLRNQIKPVVDDAKETLTAALTEVRADVRDELAPFRPLLTLIAVSLVAIAVVLLAGALRGDD